MRFWEILLAPITGNDGKLALRPLMAIGTWLVLMQHIETKATPSSDVMWVCVALIVMLLGLSTTQNIMERILPNKGIQAPAAAV